MFSERTLLLAFRALNILDKMKKIILFLMSAMLSCGMANAKVVGTVLDDKGYPLVGANVYWA